MKELTRCLTCGRVLVGQEVVHAVKGSLYCSKTCAIDDLTNDYITNARELAKEDYASSAELVRTEEILSEDLQSVEITVVCKRIVKLPTNLSKKEVAQEALKLYTDGLVTVEPDDCDTFDITCELVDEENSSVTVEPDDCDTFDIRGNII